MMKKAYLTVLLVLMTVMMLNVSGLNVSADTFKGTEERGIRILNAISLFDYSPDDAEHILTRSEFAGALAKLFGYDKYPIADANVQQFSDVAPDDANASAIYFLKSAGIMNGTGDGQFSPDSSITQMQAVKSIISALGYDFLASAEGGYPNGYLIMGYKIGLLSGGTVSDTPITVGWCAKLFMDATEVDIADMSVNGSHLTYDVSEGKNLLKVYHSILKMKKVVMTDNGITSLDGKSHISKEDVCIDGIVMKSAKPVKGYLGEKVNCYYYEDGDDAKLLYIESAIDDSSVVIHAKDIELGSVKKTQIKYTYENEEYTQDISPYAYCIYNGIAYPDFNAQTLKINSGTIKLIRTDIKDKNYDLVIIDEYDAFLVNSVAADDKCIYDKYGNNIDLSLYGNVEITDTNGGEVKLSALKQGNLLEVYKSKDNSSIKLVVNTATFEDSIAEIDKSKDAYVIGENTYYISGALKALINKGYKSLKEPELGRDYIFHTDSLGYISGMETKGRTKEYAYFLAAGSKGNFKSDIILKLIIETGEKVVVTVGDKVEINGIEKKSGDVLYIPALYQDNNIGGKFLPQLIEVKYDARGYVTSINTVTDATASKWGFTPNTFSLDFQGTNIAWNSGRKLFKYTYTADADTVIFSVPLEFDEDAIRVLTLDEILAMNSSVEIYDADETYCAGAIVTTYDSGLLTSFRDSPLFFVTAVKTVLNENDEIVKCIRGYYNNESVLCDFVEDAPGVFDSAIKDLSVGDMLRLHFSAGRKSVVGAQRIFSPKNQTKPFNVNYLDGSLPGAEFVDYMGYICGKSSTGISITADDLETIIPFTYYNTYPIIMVYDSEKKELRKGSRDDIPTPLPIMEDGTVQIDTSQPLVYGAKKSGSFHACYIIK